MQTSLDKALAATPAGREAEDILRTCVHCGFCNATCPTYQLLGDERDGPRGRIYLIKEMLERGKATRETQVHLDRCLTCRACESTCPSGVEYGRLLEIGRNVAEKQIKRPLGQSLQRAALLKTIPDPSRIGPVLSLARLVRPLLPKHLATAVTPATDTTKTWPQTHHPRKVMLMQGCVQSVTHPQINRATAQVLNRLGITALPAQGCCGALSQHLAAEEQTLDTARNNIDRWWPMVEEGAEAIVLTASGCSPTVMDYGRLLRDNPKYAGRAERISSMAMDISEFLEEQDLSTFHCDTADPPRIAFHAPCTLQHALKRGSQVEALLHRLGFELTPVAEPHMCCGSAGSYSILQKELSQRLLERKISHLESGRPERIVTANIGCQQHIQKVSSVPVIHWIELLNPV